MFKCLKSILVASVLAIGFNANAITVDGEWNDWFTYNGNQGFNNWNENLVVINNPNIIRNQNDEEGPTPGGGGQTYDIEQIFYTYDDSDNNSLTGGTLYIGLVTGFPPQGVPSDNLYAGDLFIDFGANGSYVVAVNLSERNADSTRFNQAWFNNNWTTLNTTNFPDGNPYRVNENAPGATNATSILNPIVQTRLHGKHYFYEIAIQIDGAFEDALTNENGGIGLHWTMECGNDFITVVDDTPFAPVPEPSTMALLSLGFLGLGLKRKFNA